MYVISVANEKGGVAKTTSALSVAAILAAKKYRVLMMDLDPLACLTASLGVSVAENQPTIAEIFLDHTPAKEAIIHTRYEHLDLIPSKPGLGKVEKTLPEKMNYSYALRNQIETIYSSFDFIILDCPPFMGAITINALVASHLLLIPTQAEYFGIHGLRNLFDKVKIIRSGPNIYLKSRIFLTLFNERNKVNRVLKEQLNSRLSENLLQTAITLDTKLRESQICGLPINVYAPKSRSAGQYEALVDEVIKVLSTN